MSKRSVISMVLSSGGGFNEMVGDGGRCWGDVRLRLIGTRVEK